MGIEGRDKAKALESGALALSGQLGKTVQRLRKAYNLSLSELSDQSGVAKSIISQIERNETNPTLATIWRLAQALDVSIDKVLNGSEDEPFVDRSSRGDTPILMSDDGRCRLAITGWIKTVDWLQWYDFRAEPGGVLESDAHQRGSIECLSIIDGELEVEVSGRTERGKIRRDPALPLRPPPCDPQCLGCAGPCHHGVHPQGGRHGMKGPSAVFSRHNSARRRGSIRLRLSSAAPR